MGLHCWELLDCSFTYSGNGSSDKIFFFLIFFESNGIGGVWFANTHIWKIYQNYHTNILVTVQKSKKQGKKARNNVGYL